MVDRSNGFGMAQAPERRVVAPEIKPGLDQAGAHRRIQQHGPLPGFVQDRTPEAKPKGIRGQASPERVAVAVAGPGKLNHVFLVRLR